MLIRSTYGTTKSLSKREKLSELFVLETSVKHSLQVLEETITTFQILLL